MMHVLILFVADDDQLHRLFREHQSGWQLWQLWVNMHLRGSLSNHPCNKLWYFVMSPRIHKSALHCGLDKQEINNQITQFRTSNQTFHAMQYAQGSKSSLSALVRMICTYTYKDLCTIMHMYLNMYTDCTREAGGSPLCKVLVAQRTVLLVAGPLQPSSCIPRSSGHAVEMQISN